MSIDLLKKIKVKKTVRFGDCLDVVGGIGCEVFKYRKKNEEKVEEE